MEETKQTRNWTYQEGKALIDAFRNRKEEYFQCVKKNDFWKKILHDLENMDVLTSTTTVENVKSKWKTLYRAYRFALSREGGTTPTKFIYMKDLTELLGDESLIQLTPKSINKPQIRWSTKQIVPLLEAIISQIDDDPDQFEKPSVTHFYTSLFDDYCLHELKDIGVISVKNKMRNMKDAFIKAENWKKQIGSGLLKSGREDSVEKYITRICPFYNLLEQIFGQKKIKYKPIKFDTEFVETIYNDNDSFVMEYKTESDDQLYTESQFLEEISENEESNLVTETTNEIVNEDVTQVQSNDSVNKFKPYMKKLKIDEGTILGKDSSLDYFTILQERKSNLQEKQFERKIAIEEERLLIEQRKLETEQKRIKLQNEIEIQKLELEKEKFKAEQELRKLEIEKQFELKKLELELKYKNKDD